jgi:hypothetical protein
LEYPSLSSHQLFGIHSNANANVDTNSKMHQNQNLSFYYASFEVLVSSIFPFDEQSHISYGTVY